MSKPVIIYDQREGSAPVAARVQCPGCGHVLGVDDEQFRGKVSMDCPACPYHETHDLREDD